jgi:hypothetical protein
MDEDTVAARREPVAGVVLISGDGMRVAEWLPGRADDVLVLDFPPPPDAKELRGPAASRPRGSAEGAPGARSGRQRDLFDRKLDRHHHVFVKEAAHEIGGIAEDRGWRALVVFGNPRLAADVTSVLSGALPVVEAGHGAQWLSPTELAEVVRPDIERVFADDQRALVERIRGEALAGGRGALGLDDCRTTVAEGRIEILVIDPTLPEGRTIAGAAAEQGGRVDDVVEELRPLLAEIGGACALLRW